MKIISFFILTILAFAIMVTPVLAQLETGLGYGTFTGLGTKDLREGVMTIVRIIFGFMGVLVIAAIVYGGFLMLVSGGNEEGNSNGRKVISAGIIGLVVIFLAYAITAFVIGQLLVSTDAEGF